MREIEKKTAELCAVELDKRRGEELGESSINRVVQERSWGWQSGKKTSGHTKAQQGVRRVKSGGSRRVHSYEWWEIQNRMTTCA